MSDLPERDQKLIEKELFGERPKARARFYLHGARNEETSQAAGYPIYDDRVYVEIRIPDSTDFMSRPAKREDERSYPEAFAHFQRFKNWTQHPLELLPGVTPSIKATLAELRLYTIEQLAAHTADAAPWKIEGEDDPYPQLAGELPPTLHELKTTAKRFLAFWNKPRMRLVDGKLVEAA